MKTHVTIKGKQIELYGNTAARLNELLLALDESEPESKKG